MFFAELQLREPDVRLDLHTADIGVMAPLVLDAVRRTQPDAVLVYGDTNSTLAGALAAADAQVPIAHVEAGLRSGDLSMPEERNRIEVDRISTVLFAPDERSRRTLEREQVAGQIVGDVMADATKRLEPIARRRSRILAELDLTPARYRRDCAPRPTRGPTGCRGSSRA